MLVHLVRHGEVDNPGRVTYGRLPGFGLSARGTEQAARTAAHLAARVKGPVTLVSSPLERARETAGYLHAALSSVGRDVASEVRLDERLVESGTWREGLPRAFKPLAYLARVFDADARRKREAAGAVAARMREAVLDVVASCPCDEVVLVSHQVPIWLARLAFERGFGGDRASVIVRRAPFLFVRERCALASVTTLRFEAGRLASASYWEPG